MNTMWKRQINGWGGRSIVDKIHRAEAEVQRGDVK